MTDYKSREHKQLLLDIKSFAIDWHKQRKCVCMADMDVENITEFSYIPCAHLNNAQWLFFRQRINELDEVFREEWCNKVYVAMKGGGRE